MGYSLGGGVALRTAIQHPEVVTKRVLVSTPFKRHGWLAILLPLTHYNIFSSPRLRAVVAAFLDAPVPGVR
jgi:pimeloyl-ACP methyl ester carboxylesterase